MFFFLICILFIIIILLVICKVRLCKKKKKNNLKFSEIYKNITKISNKNKLYINNNKKIFCYWHDFKLPNIIKYSIMSWYKHFPDFEIIILTKMNYKNFIKINLDNFQLTEQTFSDLLRVIVLYLYGGLWLDASIIFNDKINLDYSKINLILKTECNIKNIYESWFIYVPNRYNPIILNILKEFLYCLEIGIHNYYNLYKLDNEKCLYEYLTFYLVIHKTLNSYNNLNDIVNNLLLFNDAFYYHIKNNWDSKKTSIEIKKDLLENNINSKLIKITRNERIFLNNLKLPIYIKKNLDVIIASYNDFNGIIKLLDILSQSNHNIRCFIYEKSNTKYKIPNYNFFVKINYFKNIGREQHTYLHHIINNYDDLYDNILMTTSNIDKYGRINIIKDNLELLISNICNKFDNKTLLVEKNFKLEKYKYNNHVYDVCKSKYNNLEDWSNNVLNLFNENENRCYNGVYFINKYFIKSNNINYYIKILNDIKCDHDEISHFLERTMNLVYT